MFITTGSQKKSFSNKMPYLSPSSIGNIRKKRSCTSVYKVSLDDCGAMLLFVVDLCLLSQIHVLVMIPAPCLLLTQVRILLWCPPWCMAIMGDFEWGDGKISLWHLGLCKNIPFTSSSPPDLCPLKVSLFWRHQHFFFFLVDSNSHSLTYNPFS